MVRLGLGTVQFGLPYGITNPAGQLCRAVTAEILARAYSAGVRLLDTAPLYGDSESLLGELSSDIHVVTKTLKFSDLNDPGAAAARLEAGFERSLAALNRTHVYGLLAHDADDLLGPLGGRLWHALEGLKKAGFASCIGASVYTGRQIDALLDRFSLDLVQLPFNAVDNRLVRGGQLERLAKQGVEVHARSLFLQGLLLQSPCKVPTWLAPLPDRIVELNRLYQTEGLTALEGSLAVALRRPEISRVIVGVTSTRELEAIVVAIGRVVGVATDFECSHLAITDERILSPTRWSELGAALEPPFPRTA